MIWIDKLSERMAYYIVKQNKHVMVSDTKIEGISQEIDILRALKDELIAKELELEKSRLEWDRTFDSIIDNIIIINSDRTISKTNKSFIQCVRDKNGPWDSLIGMSWVKFKKDMKIYSDECVVSECFDTGQPATANVKMDMDIYEVTANPIFNEESGKIVGVVRISRNITKPELQKKKLERRTKIYHAISEMSKTLVNHDDWDEAVKLILGELGLSIGVNRIYVYRNIEKDTRICSVLQHCFCNDKRPNCATKSISECINYDLVPDWEDLMRKGKSVTGNLVECHICPLKDKCSCMDDVVISAVPIFVDRKWWGFIGFDYTNGTRKWKDDDETLLRIAADVLGGVIYHRGRYWNTLASLEGCEEQLTDTPLI